MTFLSMENLDWRNTPSDLQAIFSKYLEEWWPLVPTWVQEGQVSYRPDNEHLLEITVNFRNRWIVFTLTGNFFNCSEGERRQAIRHEMVHAILEPLGETIDSIIDSLSEEGTPLRSMIQKQLENSVEGVVEDLGRGIGRLRGDL